MWRTQGRVIDSWLHKYILYLIIYTQNLFVLISVNVFGAQAHAQTVQQNKCYIHNNDKAKIFRISYYMTMIIKLTQKENVQLAR